MPLRAQPPQGCGSAYFATSALLLHALAFWYLNLPETAGPTRLRGGKGRREEGVRPANGREFPTLP